MRFTLIGLAAGTTLCLTGASIFFLPAFITVGIAIDHNKKKAAQ